jgi:hypothetical protein
MNTTSRSRWQKRGLAGLLALPLCLFTLPLAAADWYDQRPPNTYPSETAWQVDPYDPVPEISLSGDCRDRTCAPGPRHGRPGPHPPLRVLPGILGHDTLLVDCGKGHSEPRHGLFNSVDEAAEHAPPNATILILPPGEGTTCVETVHVHKPLTIATYGGAGQAVLQAPPGKPCLVAHIPLGDALIIDGVRFIARSRAEPCVSVEAGRVALRNSSVDSRGSDWAFDVRESAELSVESSRIETDTSAVHARRARVELKNLDIDIDGRNGSAKLDIGRTDCIDRDGGTVHGSVGLALECSEGHVEGGSIVGGAIAVLASAGTRGLRLDDLKIAKADTGMLILPGQLGQVDVARAVIARTRDGIIVAPGADSQITAATITDSGESGISIYGAATLVSGNKVVGAGDGVRLLAPEAFPPFPDFAAITVIGGDNGGPDVENNLIANVRHAAVRIDGRAQGRQQHLHGRLLGNTFYARSPAVCIDDEYNDDPVKLRANTCNREGLVWPF